MTASKQSIFFRWNTQKKKRNETRRHDLPLPGKGQGNCSQNSASREMISPRGAVFVVGVAIVFTVTRSFWRPLFFFSFGGSKTVNYLDKKWKHYFFFGGFTLNGSGSRARYARNGENPPCNLDVFFCGCTISFFRKRSHWMLNTWNDGWNWSIVRSCEWVWCVFIPCVLFIFSLILAENIQFNVFQLVPSPLIQTPILGGFIVPTIYLFWKIFSPGLVHRRFW